MLQFGCCILFFPQNFLAAAEQAAPTFFAILLPSVHKFSNCFGSSSQEASSFIVITQYSTKQARATKNTVEMPDETPHSSPAICKAIFDFRNMLLSNFIVGCSIGASSSIRTLNFGVGFGIHISRAEFQLLEFYL